MERAPAKSFRDLGVWQKAHALADKARYMNIAEASLEECRYYLLLAKDLSYGEDTELTGLAEDVARLLAAYSRTLLSPIS